MYLHNGKVTDVASLQASMPAKESMDDKLKRLTTQAQVVLFMKGNPASPQCGFSGRIIKIIEKYLGRTEYVTFDIFSD